MAEGVEAGTGFSTSRTVAHRSADGSPTPSPTATRDELVGIARAMGATGKGVFEVVADFVDLADEFSTLPRHGGGQQAADVHHYPAAAGLSARRVQSHSGLDLRCQPGRLADAGPGRAPARRVTVSLEGRANPLRPSATYGRLESLPANNGSRSCKNRRSASRCPGRAGRPTVELLHVPILPVRPGRSPRYAQAADESIAARAASLGVPVMDLVYDVLVGRSGAGLSMSR